MKARLIAAVAVLCCGAIVLTTVWTAQADDAAKDATSAERPRETSAVEIAGFGKLVVVGPFTHKNLSLFVLCAAGEPTEAPDYLTLEEGIKQKLVEINEKGRGQVTSLLVTNRSDRPLFLHAGELVKGGKQDRTLQSSLIIPPKSVNVAIPSFCVERSRWVGGKKFAGLGKIIPGSRANAGIQYRRQGEVWSSVAKLKSGATQAMAQAGQQGDSSKPSSVNEELTSKGFTKLTGEYKTALAGVLEGLANPVGLVYAVNGHVDIANAYHAESLLKKMFGKLLDSCASDAAANQPGEKKFKPPTAKQVANFIATAWDGKKIEEKPVLGNVVTRIITDKSVVNKLAYKGEVIHVQVIRADKQNVTRTGSGRQQRD